MTDHDDGRNGRVRACQDGVVLAVMSAEKRASNISVGEQVGHDNLGGLVAQNFSGAYWA
jgi:hypothetical protein